MNRTFAQIRKLLLTGLLICLFTVSTFSLSFSAFAQGLPSGEYEENTEFPTVNDYGYGYSPYAGGREYPQQVLWGDTHLHTVYSFDAGTAGTLLTPEESYRFARGEVVTTDGGEDVRLSRPFDFLVVTDHTDSLGFFPQFKDGPEPTPEECGDDYERTLGWYEDINSGDPDRGAQASVEIIAAFSQNDIPECMEQTRQEFRTAWNDETKWAEEFNEPGIFSAVIGYEWTSLASGNNLHRNVIYRDNRKKARLMLPKTTADGTNPELLWAWLKNYQDKTGGQVLAIPHNGNISNGLMFADNMFEDERDPNGEPLTPDYAKQRQLWEPLYEVIQVKGAGETHPFLSPDDEFADFEIAGWDNGNLDLSQPETSDMYEHEYARAALKNGLKFEEDLGTNPFKFGLVGSTDSHMGLSSMEENNFMGKFPIYTPSPERAAHISKESSFNKTRIKNAIDDKVPEPIQEKIGATGIMGTIKEKLSSKGITKEDIPEPIQEKLIPEVKRFGWQYGAAGFVGVWAQENTRASIFDAMKKREVYATSGPRMVVRLFGGWDFTDEDLGRNPGDVGYAKGVPMGSDLTVAPVGKSPTFLVAALKDPIRGNLDRIQIVKGWLDANGETHEKVYNVAWSDRPNDTADNLSPVGNTVNTETAEWTNTIGATELATVWTDTEFDPSQRAFYYARVLEIPTPRWTDYDKAFFPDAEIPEEAPLTLQERVYTSPIWYSPA
ncbi:MAG: DUF3604 domain-containing protein [Symploca sp. SIO2C1]|nr:DUF3604 domain-containing protein [Symploca sp. SIO2C1]